MDKADDSGGSSWQEISDSEDDNDQDEIESEYDEGDLDIDEMIKRSLNESNPDERMKEDLEEDEEQDIYESLLRSSEESSGITEASDPIAELERFLQLLHGEVAPDGSGRGAQQGTQQKLVTTFENIFYVEPTSEGSNDCVNDSVSSCNDGLEAVGQRKERVNESQVNYSDESDLAYQSEPLTISGDDGKETLTKPVNPSVIVEPVMMTNKVQPPVSGAVPSKLPLQREKEKTKIKRKNISPRKPRLKDVNLPKTQMSLRSRAKAHWNESFLSYVRAQKNIYDYYADLKGKHRSVLRKA